MPIPSTRDDGAPTALPDLDSLAAALAAGADESARAAHAMHAARAWHLVAPLGDALRRALAQAPNAALILLLGHDPGAQNIDLLRELYHSDSVKSLKLGLASPAVPLQAVAVVALSAAGDRAGRKALHLLADSPDLAMQRFLLEVLDDIDDPATLQQMRRYLADEREVPGGVPHGAAPARRLADLAADALIARLKLKVGFAPRPAGRYEPQQLAEVDRLVRAAIPA